MSWISKFLKSSIGAKLVMAVTGLILIGFILGHLAGNLQMWAGDGEAINAYAQWLKDRPYITWPTRLLLLPVFVLHVAMAIRLTAANKAARPVPYAHPDTVQASLASRAMIHSGAVVGLYLIYHLLHFTFGVVGSEGYALTDAQGRHDVYNMVITGFEQPLVSLVYVLANAMLAWHLSHGIASMFQTLGVNDPRYTPLIKKVGIAAAALIGAGYISIPLGVLLGLIH